MGYSLDIESESWGVGDKSWIATTNVGVDEMRTITLDLTLFNALHYPNGYLPSGIVLGKVTATGLYGPYSPLLANGLDVNAGHLYDVVRVIGGTGQVHTKAVAALFHAGIVRTTKLPTFTGAAAAIGVLDTNGRADRAAWIRYEDN